MKINAPGFLILRDRSRLIGGRVVRVTVLEKFQDFCFLVRLPDGSETYRIPAVVASSKTLWRKLRDFAREFSRSSAVEEEPPLSAEAGDAAEERDAPGVAEPVTVTPGGELLKKFADFPPSETYRPRGPD